jgi:CDP-4-dehydro-6-deoxyglucose reductase
MPEWFPATLTESRAIGDSLTALTLDVPSEVATSFHTPGQYHRVRIGSVDNRFAMASAPRQSRFDYLVRRHKALLGAWASLPVGAQLEVGLVEGPGFPLRLAYQRTLLMIATGTGFAPIRSVLQAIVADRSHYGAVHVLAGLHSPREVPYPAETAAWAAAGFHVHHVISQPDTSWQGHVGHVQAHLSHLPVDDALAFLCGQPEMVTEVTAALGRRGLPPERVFLNLPRL